MKKILFITFLLVVFFLCGFNRNENDTEEEIRGVFLSYIEEQKYLDNDYEKSKNNIKNIIKSISDNNFNLIILQIRSTSDAIYDSDIFPYSSNLTGVEGESYFDVLEYFIEVCKKYEMEIYVWINPYRIRTNNDIKTISTKNPAYKYIGTDYIYIDNGIYYNPSKQEVEDLIVSGVEEILNNYQIDGVLFDDYFYPSDEIDSLDYTKYIEENGYIDAKVYRLNIINKMIRRVHEVCKKKNVQFGVSPDGNINNNYNYIYADIYRWLDSDQYVDFIMPQIYYGFFNEKMPFYNVVNEWNQAIKNKNIKLIVALALYKSGSVDKYALSGSQEWINSKDIIKREVIISRNMSHYEGFTIFRYDNLLSSDQNENMKAEASNLQQILN